MNQRAVRHYRRLREKSWPAKEAFRSARVKALFEELEAQELVRLRVESDDDMDQSYLSDRECFSKEDEESEIERAHRLGTWGIIVEARHPLSGEDGPWLHIESCWGFVGDDWKDSGYDTDFMQAAIAWINQFEGMAA